MINIVFLFLLDLLLIDLLLIFSSIWICHFDSVVSLGAEPENQGFKLVKRCFPPVFCVILSIRSFFTVQLQRCDVISVLKTSTQYSSVFFKCLF